MCYVYAWNMQYYFTSVIPRLFLHIDAVLQVMTGVQRSQLAIRQREGMGTSLLFTCLTEYLLHAQ